MTRPRQRARQLYAAALVKRHGSTVANAASNIEHGHFENIWITPALDALEVALRGLPDDDEGDDSGR